MLLLTFLLYAFVSAFSLSSATADVIDVHPADGEEIPLGEPSRPSDEARIHEVQPPSGSSHDPAPRPQPGAFPQRAG